MRVTKFCRGWLSNAWQNGYHVGNFLKWPGVVMALIGFAAIVING